MSVPDHLAPGDRSPKYNVKAVSHLVGVSPVTLRAWERRYGLPRPQRGAQGYRLYSEYDVQTLRWLKTQTETGMSISRAAQHLADLRLAGADPAQGLRPEAPSHLPASTENLTARCMSAWLALDDETAREALQTAFSLYPLEQVMTEVIQPALVQIGELWQRGEVPVAVEHFATHFCLRYLMSLAAAAGTPSRPGLIVAAGAPGEHHEVGLLMLVVLLRWRGWDVKYLGPNLKLEGLDKTLAPLRPQVLLFSATRSESAAALAGLPRLLENLSGPRPRVIVGGQGFDEAGPRAHGWTRLQGLPADLVRAIEGLMPRALGRA